MQTVQGPVAFEVARHQLYESQIIISNINVSIKLFSISMGRAKIKSFSLKSDNKTFQLLLLYGHLIIVQRSNLPAHLWIERGWNFLAPKARIKHSNFHCHCSKIDHLSSLASNRREVHNVDGMTLLISLNHKRRSYIQRKLWYYCDMYCIVGFMKLLQWSYILCQITRSSDHIKWLCYYNYLLSSTWALISM